MKLLAVLFIFAIGVAIGVMVMMNGWGLVPVSWGWIIGGAVAQYGLMIIAMAIDTRR